MKLLVGLFLFLSLLAVQSPKVYRGVVDRVDEYKAIVVFRELPNDDPECEIEINRVQDVCKYTMLDIPLAEYPKQWKTVALNVNTGETTERAPQVGDVVKAEGEKLVALESCEVRRDRGKYQWRKDHPGYDRMPFVLNTLPDDCQPWYYK